MKNYEKMIFIYVLFFQMESKSIKVNASKRLDNGRLLSGEELEEINKSVLDLLSRIKKFGHDNPMEMLNLLRIYGISIEKMLMRNALYEGRELIKTIAETCNVIGGLIANNKEIDGNTIDFFCFNIYAVLENIHFRHHFKTYLGYPEFLVIRDVVSQVDVEKKRKGLRNSSFLEKLILLAMSLRAGRGDIFLEVAEKMKNTGPHPSLMNNLIKKIKKLKELFEKLKALCPGVPYEKLLFLGLYGIIGSMYIIYHGF